MEDRFQEARGARCLDKRLRAATLAVPYDVQAEVIGPASCKTVLYPASANLVFEMFGADLSDRMYEL